MINLSDIDQLAAILGAFAAIAVLWDGLTRGNSVPDHVGGWDR